MNCPSCNTPLEPNARFCGVCGYRLAPNRAVSPPSAQAPGRAPQRLATPAGASPQLRPPLDGRRPRQAQAQAARAKPKLSKGDELYINQVLNNRFKVESKIGEGGFGAVYRGVQLATGRKVALKL